MIHKFRGKRIDNGKWVYGSLLSIAGLCSIERESQGQHIHSIIKTEFGDLALEAVAVIPETVGQFTGLKDKNDKEIYEGDVVRWDDKASTDDEIIRQSVVSFQNGFFGVMGNWAMGEMWDRKSFEIIGNIHENPKLLE